MAKFAVEFWVRLYNGYLEVETDDEDKVYEIVYSMPMSGYYRCTEDVHVEIESVTKITPKEVTT